MDVLIVVGVLAVLVWAIALYVGRRMRRLRFAAPVALLLTVGVAAGGWQVLAEPAPWDQVSATDARTLRVSYSGSECEGHHSVGVKESDSSVTISIKTREWSAGCSDVGFRRQVDVTLAADLGDRTLIDGSCRFRGPGCERTLSGD